MEFFRGAILIACLPWQAFVMQRIWEWYAPMAGIDHTPRVLFFFGLSVFVTMFKEFTYNEDEDDEAKWVKAILYVIVPAFILLMAWLGYALFA